MPIEIKKTDIKINPEKESGNKQDIDTLQTTNNDYEEDEEDSDFDIELDSLL